MSLDPLDLQPPRATAGLIEDSMMVCDSIEEKSLVGLVGNYSLSIQDLRRLQLRNVKENLPDYGIIEATNWLGMPVLLRVRGETWQALRHVLRNHPLRAVEEAPVFVRHKIDEPTRRALERGEPVEPDRLMRNNCQLYDAFRRVELRLKARETGEWPWRRRRRGDRPALFERFRQAWDAGPLTHPRRGNRAPR